MKKSVAQKMKFLGVFATCLLLICLFTYSCDRYDDDIANIKTDIEQLKADVKAIAEAYEAGKIITQVTPLDNAPAGSWLITFSDNTSIEVRSGQDGANGKDGKDGADGIDGQNGADGKDGQDGITPYIRVNDNNYWEISYDNGETFEELKDSEGNPIPATGASGSNGKDGKDGFSVRVIINEDGYYTIEIYDPATDDVKETIVTNYHSNPQYQIQSIVEDPISGTITITMANGDEYIFGQVVIYPSSIILLSKSIEIPHNGTQTIEFRINPSNARVNLDEVLLDLVSEGTRAEEVSYVTTPVNYTLQSVKAAKNDQGVVKRGQYVATIKDNEISPDYSDDVAIVISTKDSKGNPMEISSELIKVSAKQPSNLPKVYITTPDGVGIKSKVDWVKNSTIRIVDENGKEDLNVTTSIRGRGNSTWGMPKKPYALKLDSKAKVLGMPKHKRWVLLANWMDRTLLRNAVAFEMARLCMDWAPRGRFVELYLNGKHQGNYYLCEQIKPDENRVNIDEIDEDTPESDLTGGYLLEFDTYSKREVNYFYTQHKQYPVTIKEPDEEVIVSWEHPAFVYIQNYVNQVESTFVAGDYEEVKNLIDITSYIDWYLVHEVTRNGEPNHPKSSYMYKARNGKLYAGPVWDFDWGTFRPNRTGLIIKGALWYGYLFTHDEFKTTLKARWAELKPQFENLVSFIEEQAELIRESNEVNIKKWPIDGANNGDEQLSFDDAIKTMIDAYTQRIQAVDTALAAL